MSRDELIIHSQRSCLLRCACRPIAFSDCSACVPLRSGCSRSIPNKAVEDKTLRGALGTELQNKSFETYECAKSIDSHIFTIAQIATRKYDMRFKPQFTISSEGLPIPCSNVADTAPAVPLTANKERFNPDYLGSDGKIDKAKLFASLLNDHCLTWNDLRAQIMHVANVRSPHFAEKLITEAKEAGILDTIIDKDALRKYTWRSKTTLFDEAP